MRLDDFNVSSIKTANIRKAKTNYYKRYFETNLGDIKKSWKGVNSILGQNLPTTEINRIDVRDKSSTTPLESPLFSIITLLTLGLG